MNAPLKLHAYGWAQLDDGDWQFRDPSIAELVWLQSQGCWTTHARVPVSRHYGGRPETVRGMPDFVLGPDGQITAERGFHVLQPQQPFVVSEGGLTVSSLYGASKSPRAHDFEFHRSNPHLHGVDPSAPIPRGTRVHVPHRWVANLRGNGYGVHAPTAKTGVGNMAVTADTLAKAQAAAVLAAQVAAQAAALEAIAGAAGNGAAGVTGLGDAGSISAVLATLQGIVSTPITADSGKPLLGWPTGKWAWTDFYSRYVQAAQAAGQIAVDTLGPDINITLGEITKPFTSAAWTLNGELSKIRSQDPDLSILKGVHGDPNPDASTSFGGPTPASIADANRAKYLLGAMIAQYVLAMHAVKAAPPGATSPSAAPPGAQAAANAILPAAPVAPLAPPPGSPSISLTAPLVTDKKPDDSSSTPWIIGGVVAGAALLGVAVAVLKKKAEK